MDIYRKIVCTYIDMNDITNADAVIAEIQTKFTKNANLARTNFDIGNYFLNDANDPENALKMHAYNADNCTNLLEAMWSQAAIVWYHVRHKDNDKADAAYAKMLEVFKDQKTLAKECYQIADIWTEVGNYDKAIELSEYTIETWPESEYKLDAQKSIVKAQFESNDFAAAEQTLDELIADNAENNQLPQSILTFGQDYYNKGLEIYQGKTPHDYDGNTSAKEKSTNNFQKSLAIWLRTTGAIEAAALTADYAMTAEYYHYAGTCRRLLGDYDKAIEYYKKVINNWPEYEAAGGVAGIIPTVYERMGNEGLISGEEAEKLIIESYQDIIKRYPNTAAANAAQNKIKRYQKTEEITRRGSRPIANRGGQQ